MIQELTSKMKRRILKMRPILTKKILKQHFLKKTQILTKKKILKQHFLKRTQILTQLRWLLKQQRMRWLGKEGQCILFSLNFSLIY